MIPWLQVYSNLPSHPKTYKLAEALKLPNYTVVGILVCMWSWAEINTPDGNLSVYPNPKKIIEDAVGWTKKSPNLYQALIDTSWLDIDNGVCMIHDWKDYSVRGFEEKRKIKNAEKQKRWREKQKGNVDGTALRNDNEDSNGYVTVMDEVTGDVTHNRNDNRMSPPTIHNITEHNNTIHNISPPNPLNNDTCGVGGGTADVPSGEREEKDNDLVLRERMSECAGYYRKHVNESVPTKVFEIMNRLFRHGAEPDLVKHAIKLSAKKQLPQAYFDAVAKNLIADNIKTYMQYENVYGKAKQSSGDTSESSFDTDEFFELAVKRTYEKIEKINTESV